MKHCKIYLIAPLFVALSVAARGQSPAEEINMGYITRPAEAVTGAVSTVSGGELGRSPVANLSRTFAGRLSGVINIEGDGRPGKMGTVAGYIRGITTVNGTAPLIILDGIICSLESIDYIIPQEVESITVLKDASVTAIYGAEGGNGAIIVNTKRGRNEGLKVTATFDQSWQQMTRRPVFINSWEYAAMRNEAWRNDGASGQAPFSQAMIDAFRDGTNRGLYPNTDFYGMMFRPWAMMQRASIDTGGGNDRIRMYSNINFMHQGGQFIHDGATFGAGEMGYDPNAGESYRINFRTNLDFDITKILGGYLRLNGNVTKESAAGNSPGYAIGESHNAIYRGLFMLPPTLYGPYTPLEEGGGGGNILTNEYVDNPSYGMLNRSGYGRFTGTNIMAQAGLNLDMDFLTEGLDLTGMFAYETNSSGYHHIGADYQRWVRSNDPDNPTFDRIGVGTWDDKPLDHDGRSGLGYKLSLFSYRLHANVKLDYERRFGNHSVAAMAYGYYQNYISGSTASIQGFPYNRVAVGASASYGYGGRYYVNLDAAYSGSEQFARARRFVLTPALSAGWIVSNESFIPDNSWLTMLKLRASVGITANDRIGEGRFMYADNYINGGPLYVETLGYMISEYMTGNPGLAPEKIVKQNYGLDLRLFDELSLSVDYFRSVNTNMLVNPSGKTPAFAGRPAGVLAPVNGGRMLNHGVEARLEYAKSINADIDIRVGGNFTFARNRIEEHLELPLGSDYATPYRSEGHPAYSIFGYLIDRSEGGGYFTTQEQLDGVYYTFGTPRLGDFRYKNLNGDKTEDGRDIIDEKDHALIGRPLIPEIVYGVDLGFRYKGFELNLLIQGAANSSRSFYGAMGVDESLSYGGIYSDIHLGAWTQQRAAAGDKITFPALSTRNSTSRQYNDFFVMNTSYVRLKNLEVAWSLPESWLKPVRAHQIKFVLSANNLFTIDRLPTKAIDPEIGSLDTFQNYKVFNIGVRMTF